MHINANVADGNASSMCTVMVVVIKCDCWAVLMEEKGRHSTRSQTEERDQGIEARKRENPGLHKETFQITNCLEV